MLVISRKLGESVYIGDDISVTVVDIEKGRIRIGIKAPFDVPILREELVTEINEIAEDLKELRGNKPATF